MHLIDHVLLVSSSLNLCLLAVILDFLSSQLTAKYYPQKHFTPAL